MKYRVIMPIDLGDGKIHVFGDVITIADPAIAKAYSHALQAVKEANPYRPRPSCRESLKE